MEPQTHKLPEINSNAGNIKWRQHELILVTAIAVIRLGSYLWYMFHLPTEEMNMRYANVFKETHVPFNLYRNLILPDICIGFLIYLSYLWLSLYTVPRLLFSKKFEAGTSKISVSFSKISLEGLVKKIIKQYAWLFIQVLFLILLLGVASDIATYFRHEWQFHYPGFSIFFNKNNPNSQLSLTVGFFDATAMLILYALYVCVREFIIHLIQVSKQRAFNTLICNKVSLFVLLFTCAAIFLRLFNIIHDGQFFVSFSLYIPALFAMYISNVYWLFPMKGNDLFFRKKIIIRLLCTSFIYSIPLTVFIHEQGPIALLYSWAEQLFIVTPLTWWYYQTNKDRILQLRVVEKELVKSKANLQFLRSQINPHFLFNVLNTLYGTALQENAERTAGGIQRLGDMMRFMLHENNLDFIEMRKEIDYLKNYIALQKLRTQSSPEIIIEDNISDQNCNYKIAPMLLIPLVENAFKHGISLKERSWIKINLECTEKNILFEVRNSMHEKNANDPEKERSGIGFKNVLERLKLIYGNRFQISVNGDGKEFFVQLSIQP
jgi:two-component system LytT family sensor kinase